MHEMHVQVADLNAVIEKLELAGARIGPDHSQLDVLAGKDLFEAIDLVNLDNYHIYVKMSIDGVTSPAFSAVTLPRFSTVTL